MSQRTIAVPAGAFSYAHYYRFKLKSEGIEWIYDEGYLTFTVPRPRDYVGGNVTVRLLFKCKGGFEGNHRFFVAVTAHNTADGTKVSASSYTPYMDLPGPDGGVYASSIDFAPDDGLDTGDWWYVKLNRHGKYRNNIVMMSAGIDYEATDLPPSNLPLVRKAEAPARKAPAKARKPAKKSK